MLIALNGFYVAGEFALVAVDRSRVEHLAEQGHRGAKTTLAGLKSLSFQLSGAQLGITVSSLLLGFVLEPTLGQAFEPLLDKAGLPPASAQGVSLALALAIATASQMVFGELIPKNLAIARPEAVAFKVTGLLRLNNILWKPLVYFLNASANWTVRRLGIEPQDELIPNRSLEELQVLIESSREGGMLQEGEYSLLARSVSFGGKTAGEALRPRVALETMKVSDTIEDMRELSLETGYSRFPVVGRDIDDIVGVAHVRDIFRVPVEGRADTTVATIMQEAPIFPESVALSTLLVQMRRERKQMAIIVDEYGGTAGIVTIEDLVEEIVGEIEDEHDPDGVAPALTSPLSGVQVVSGMLHASEIEEMTGFEIPDGDYETLAGFLLSRFDRIPEVGDHTTYDGWELKVVAMDKKRIDKVLIVAPSHVGADDGGDPA